MRRALCTLAITATAAASAAVLTALPAAAADPAAAGSYVAITPYRAADTHTGVNGNRKGRLAAGTSSRVSLAGHVPTSASAAVVSVSAVGASTNGFLTLYRDGTSVPATWTELYRAGVTTTVTTIVPLAAAEFLIHNGATTGSTDFAVDVVGYYVGGTVGGGSGLLHVATPRRLIQSSTTLGPGRSVTAHLGPAGINSTVALLLHTLGASRGGSLSVYPTETTAPALSTAYYPAGFGSSVLTQVRLGDDGNAVVTNRGSGSIRIAVDQLGYSARSAAQVPGALQPLPPTRIATGATVAKGAVARFTLAGRSGMPLTGIGTALVAVAVGSPSSGGGVDVAAAGRSSAALRSVSFRAGETVGAQLPVATANGQIDVRNTTGGSLRVYLDVLGYYPSTAARSTTVGVGRYLSTLVDSRTSGYLAKDLTIVEAWAASDKAAGATTVLLDLGAQTTHAPLSTTTRGVALAENSEYRDSSGAADPARLSYADLATLLTAYAEGNPGARVLAAVNNEGDWASYTAGQRAVDFATMIDSISTNNGSKVVAAGDFEPGFNDNQNSAPGNALTWKHDYQYADLAAAASPRPFVFVGAASGCPTTFGATTACTNPGSDDWTQAQLAELASGTDTTALPQVYFNQSAIQWADIAAHATSAITFEGTLSQAARADDSELTADQSNAALYRALSWVQSTPQLGPDAVAIGVNGS